MKEFIPFPEYHLKSKEEEWWLGPAYLYGYAIGVY